MNLLAVPATACDVRSWGPSVDPRLTLPELRARRACVHCVIDREAGGSDFPRHTTPAEPLRARSYGSPATSGFFSYRPATSSAARPAPRRPSSSIEGRDPGFSRSSSSRQARHALAAVSEVDFPRRVAATSWSRGSEGVPTIIEMSTTAGRLCLSGTRPESPRVWSRLSPHRQPPGAPRRQALMRPACDAELPRRPRDSNAEASSGCGDAAIARAYDEGDTRSSGSPPRMLIRGLQARRSRAPNEVSSSLRRQRLRGESGVHFRCSTATLSQLTRSGRARPTWPPGASPRCLLRADARSRSLPAFLAYARGERAQTPADRYLADIRPVLIASFDPDRGPSVAPCALVGLRAWRSR